MRRHTPLDITIYIIMLGISAVMLIVAFSLPPIPFDRKPNLKITAGPYIPPANCSANNVQVLSTIETNCASDVNIIANASEYGLTHQSRGDKWIRIGNDALNVQCNPITKCYVNHVANGKFISK